MWFKVDDKAHSHPKVIEAGNAAMGLWMRCGSWSGERLTEGFIPRKTARMFGTLGEIRRLVEAGLFLDVDGGYQMHDFLEYNLTADQVKDLQGKRSTAGKKGAQARWGAKANDMANAMAPEIANRCPEPEPEPVGTSNATDRLTTTTPDVRRPSTIDDAIDLQVRLVLHHTGHTATSRTRYAEGIRRNVTLEHGPALAAHLERHPDATAEQLAAAIFGHTELDLFKIRKAG